MSAPLPPKSQQELLNMAPAARDQYLQQQADAGYPDDGSWFGNLIGDFKRAAAENASKQQAAAMGTKNVKTLSAGHDVQFVPGLQASDGRYLGTDHAQLKQYVNTNLNASQVTDVSNAYAGVQQAFDNFGTKFTDAVTKSQGAWEGDSAESARGYFSSLTKWSDANAQNAQLAAETIYEQSNAATAAKNKMPDPVPFNWDDEFKKWATAGPLDMGSAVSDSLKLQQQSQQAHEEAAGVMSEYDKDLYTAASKQPVFVDPPKFAASGGPGTSATLTSGGGGGGTHASDVNAGGGAVGSGHSGDNSSSGSSSGGPTHQQLQQGNTVGGGTVAAPGHTTAQSFQPSSSIAPPPSGSANTGMGPMPMGGGMGGGMGGFGEAEEYSSKIGRGGGFGPGGSSSLPTGGQQSGSGSGAAKPGGVGAAESAAGRGMGGAAAPGKSSTSGGMGAGRGKGEGDEDQEHQRPTYLVEGDPDEVFGSNERTSPPVIGE